MAHYAIAWAATTSRLVASSCSAWIMLDCIERRESFIIVLRRPAIEPLECLAVTNYIQLNSFDRIPIARQCRDNRPYLLIPRHQQERWRSASRRQAYATRISMGMISRLTKRSSQTIIVAALEGHSLRSFLVPRRVVAKASTHPPVPAPATGADRV